MIAGGNATILVADFDRSIHFYTTVLGLRLTKRFGNDWATLDAGPGLTIGLHPASPQYPAPGTKGSVLLGLDLQLSIEEAVARLGSHGIPLQQPLVRNEVGAFARILDPDGNAIYLWDKSPQQLSHSADEPLTRVA